VVYLLKKNIMKKAIYILFIIPSFFFNKAFAQFNVDQVSIYANNVIDSGEIINGYFGSPNYSIFLGSELEEFFGYYNKNVKTQDSEGFFFVHEEYQDTQYYQDPTDVIEISFSTFIDTTSKTLFNLNALSGESIIYNSVQATFSHRMFACDTIHYQTSQNGKVISIELHGQQVGSVLKEIGRTVDDYPRLTEKHTRFEKIVDIPDSAYLSISLNVSFPLTVSLANNIKIPGTINSRLKKLTLATYVNFLPCYDLLGRKYPLEFLGTDGQMSTYSFRSLRPGVYFVSDGKEMVKFLVTE
jgi:hypothetical protein